MRYRSTRPTRAYAAIPNSAMRDTRISIEARGVLGLLMTYADSWEFRADHLRQVAGIGRDKFSRIMRELNEAKYVERKTKQDENGKLSGSEWIIRDEPDRQPENPAPGDADPLKNRQSDSSKPGKQAPIRRPKEQEHLNLCLAQSDEYADPSFDAFWKAYPRPKDRDGTAHAFAHVVADGADPAQIIAGAKAYAAEEEGNARQYLKHSKNWINAKGWLDYNISKPSQADVADAAKVKDNFARAIGKGKAAIGGHCPALVALELIAEGKVTQEQCRAVGVRV